MRWVLPLLLLGGCVAVDAPTQRAGQAAPAAVILYRDTVTVEFSDGRFCTGVRAARSGGWAGTLAGCPHGWPFAVRRPTDRPRVPLSPGAADPWVTLTGPEGVLGFAPGAAPSS